MALGRLPLAQFTPHLASSGYSLAAGSLTLRTQARIDQSSYDTSTDLVISALDVGGTEGESLFLKTFGIPLSVALGLLKDLHGDIHLSVPVTGDRAGVRLDIASLTAQALRKALVGALASPLKLLGAVTGAG